MDQIDVRIEQADTIVSALLSKKELDRTQVLITEDNKLIFNSMGSFLFYTELNNIAETYPPIGYDYATRMVDHNIALNLQYYKRNFIDTMFPLVAKIDDVTEDLDYYDKFTGVKGTVDSHINYNLNNFHPVRALDNSRNYFIPIIYKFPALNKDDTMSIKVYRYNETFLLLKYEVYKKKLGRNINVYMKIIDLK